MLLLMVDGEEWKAEKVCCSTREGDGCCALPLLGYSCFSFAIVHCFVVLVPAGSRHIPIAVCTY